MSPNLILRASLLVWPLRKRPLTRRPLTRRPSPSGRPRYGRSSSSGGCPD